MIATPLVIFLLGPILPPGNGSEQASGQVTDNTVLLAMATPVLLLVVIYLIYAVIVLPPAGRAACWKARPCAVTPRLQTAWIVITSALVLSLAAYGTVRLLADNGAGSGSGPKPLTVPNGQEAAGAGDRPAVGVHLPLPDLRRRRDHPPRAAGRTRWSNCTSPRST